MKLSTRVALVLIIVAGLCLSFLPTTPVRSAPSADDLLSQLEWLSGGTAQIAYHAHTGYVRFVGVSPQHAIQAESGPATPAPAPETVARQFLNQYGSLFGLTDPERELSLMKEQTDPTGSSMVRFQQVFAGIPVLAGELIVNLDEKKAVLSASGEILPRPRVDPAPGVDAQTARQTALGVISRQYGIAVDGLSATSPELWVYDPILLADRATAPTRLVWRMEVSAGADSPVREIVLVDAHQGGVVLHFNQVDTLLRLQTYTAKNTQNLPGTLVCDQTNPTCSTGDLHAQGAHIYASDTYNYFKNNFNRDSINGAGMTIRSTVHYKSGYDNAFWSGTQMVYGDFYGFPLADDVVAHELTHGVTDYSSRLFYIFQSGAINEAISDIFGEFVDQTNGKGNDTAAVKWLMGEDITGLGAIRDMRNPHNFFQPERMTDSLYWDCGGLYPDYGGVHTNSGVANKAAYLMTDGDTFNGKTVVGIGLNKVGAIWYYAETHLLTSGSNYDDLYTNLQQACGVLVGTNGITVADCQEVKKALDAVEMNLQPVGCGVQEAPVCTGTRSPTTLYNDDFEPPAPLRWTKTLPWYLIPAEFNMSYATGGSSSLMGYDQPVAADYSAIMNTSVFIPPVTLTKSPYLRFNHSYSFDLGGFDGGIVQYALDGTNNWVNAGSLMVNNGYNGTILTGYGNPLGGTPAFISDSYGYTSTRLDLSSLAGHTTRFRFRIGTDKVYDAPGWFIDDFRIYTCDEPMLVLPLFVRVVPVVNGDFEKGAQGWARASSSASSLITNSLPGGVVPHSGSYAVWLGGKDNETGWISQSVHVPAGYTKLHFYVRIDSLEANAGMDQFTVSVNGTPMPGYPLDLTVGSSTAGWVEYTLDLAAYAGQNVTLKFAISTDAAGGISSLFLDDVSLTRP